jgi:hypothetical protein
VKARPLCSRGARSSSVCDGFADDDVESYIRALSTPNQVVRITSTAAGLFLGLTLATLPIAAQAQRPISLGVAAGVPFPLGEFHHEVNPGLRVLGTVTLDGPTVPFGLRLDAGYDRFGFKSTPVGAAGRSTGAQQVVSVTLDPTYRLSSAASPFAPYLIGGAGSYSIGCTGVARCDGVTRIGWNAGLGARFTTVGVRWFTEARYHRVKVPATSVQYVPVTIGLLF